MSDAGIPNFGCLAHTLNLVVKNALEIATGARIDDLGDLLSEDDPAISCSDYEKLHKKFSKMVTRTRKSSNARREFIQCQVRLYKLPLFSTLKGRK